MSDPKEAFLADIERIFTPEQLTKPASRKHVYALIGEVGKQAVTAIAELRARVAELEATALHDGGVWDGDKQYRSGALVSYRGSGWIAKAASRGVKPGDAAGVWRLAVKQRTVRDE